MEDALDTTVNDVQGYLAQGIALMPRLNMEFLQALHEKELRREVCLVPFSRFELYHLKLEQKVRARIRVQELRAA